MYYYGGRSGYPGSTGDASSVDGELQAAHAKGRWSFVLKPPSLATTFVASDLLVADVPPWAARMWTVSLSSFRYFTGPIVGGIPPDNQTDSSAQYRARVQWGVDGANDEAVVDYYARGCSFQVHAGNIRVSLFSDGPTLDTPPTLAGFLVAQPRATSIGAIQSPSFTTSVVNIPGAPGTALVFLPARAVAYRLWQLGAPGGVVTVAQRDESAVVQRENAQAVATYSDGGNRAGYTPLNPRAQSLLLENIAVGPTPAGVQFLLDLG